ncbi:MAG: molybdate ABC transporter substrate-binding protein, partial [Clostridia bacterium]
MKKILALLLALTMVFALAACGGTPAAPPAPAEQPAEAPAEQPAEEPAPAGEPAPAEELELIVFAAASMTETLTEIKALYETAHPGVTITYNFDSSGTLK